MKPTLFLIFSLFLLGCDPPKIEICVLDFKAQLGYCYPPNNGKEHDVKLSDLHKYTCLSPVDYATLLKWIEDHEK